MKPNIFFIMTKKEFLIFKKDSSIIISEQISNIFFKIKIY